MHLFLQVSFVKSNSTQGFYNLVPEQDIYEYGIELSIECDFIIVIMDDVTWEELVFVREMCKEFSLNDRYE